jgi:hypothetical protein
MTFDSRGIGLATAPAVGRIAPDIVDPGSERQVAEKRREGIAGSGGEDRWLRERVLRALLYTSRKAVNPCEGRVA